MTQINSFLRPRRITRRLAMSAGTGAMVAAAAGLAHAQRSAPPATVPVEELMKSEIPDIVIGNPEAPVTIVEYASMTCSHCANFHNTVYPQLKAKYIDTGKARLVFREYPLDNLAFAASMLARCSGGEGPPAMISDLFKRQADWAFVRGNPVPKLFEFAKQAGFTQASFDKCLTDQKLLDQLTAVRSRASDKFGVSSTPTFFVNGRRLNGSTLADFDKAIEPVLKGK